ncbi:isoleucine--tRNA ligase [bacterium]|nr:isoleucine--tRNA ligase [bacterium]
MYKKVNPRENFPELEEKILKFWNENKIFEESVNKPSNNGNFSFYDGPPFATGLPHYGHLVAGTIKDVFPRYKTMQGFKVERIWGWDTHGLPIENIVEQELDFKTKDQVEEYGIDNFNEKCREKVLVYAEEWKKIVERTGRWIDMDNAYLTMNIEFMESVWWVFKSLYEKGLIYEGHKVMPYCPRCSTPLSNFEVGQGYKDKNDKAITVKFQSEEDKNLYFLAWTTTPWTLPGNLALTVGSKIEYAVVSNKKEKYILAKDRLDSYKEELGDFKVEETLLGEKLVGNKYKPIFDYYKNPKKAFEIITGDFVSTEDGTGIVHTAPAFGEDDNRVAKEHGIDFFMPVDDMGNFTIDVPEYAGQSVVEFNTNENIINDLENKVLKVENITHSYPHCWRCKTPLLYKGVSSWFVAVSKVKDKMLKSNQETYWLPDAIGHARFKKLIENAPDWSISRNRFWGTPIPVWRCEECKKVKIIGGSEELKNASGSEIKDIHLHKIKDINIKCECGKDMKLSGEVLDCWFESGSMPFASIHYPYENEEKFERDFPADFIAEGIDQTRGWFYSLMVLSNALFDKSSFKSVVVNGTILAEDGQKMSKSLKNYPDPMDIVHKYGADAMRFYLMGSPAVKAEDLRFSEKGVDEVLKKVILTLWNSYSFFVTYASLDNFKPTGNLKTENVLDKWILSKLNNLVKNITEKMDKYELSITVKDLSDFVDSLSNWYIRRSRKRFWKSENDFDKLSAYEVLNHCLVTYVKILSPFMPFVSEEIYQNLVISQDAKEEKSIHLTSWPEPEKNEDNKVEENMDYVRLAVEAGLSKRAENAIKVRQPLKKLTVSGSLDDLPSDYLEIIKEEVNIKEVVLKKSNDFTVELDTKLTTELEQEGIAREFVRTVQSMRKKADFNVEDRIKISYSTQDKKVDDSLSTFSDNSLYNIKKETLADIITTESLVSEYSEDVKINGIEVTIGINRVK